MTENNQLPYLSPEIIQNIAYFSDRRERQILGFTIELCIFLKFPPNRIGSHIFVAPIWKTTQNPGRTYWYGYGMRIERFLLSRLDRYSINTDRYEWEFNYDTGKINHWIDEPDKCYILTEIHPAYIKNLKIKTES